MPWVNAELCKGCGACVDACPVPGAVEMVDEHAVVNADLCDGCGECETACPTGAMTPGQSSAVSPEGEGRASREVTWPLAITGPVEKAYPVQPPLPQSFLTGSHVIRSRPVEERGNWIRTIADILRGAGGRAADGRAADGRMKGGRGAGRQGRQRGGRRGGRGKGRGRGRG